MAEQRVPLEAVEKVARERWMRSRVAAQVERNAIMADWEQWEHLSIETQDQKLHEARQDLEIAYEPIRRQVLAEVREALTEKLEKRRDEAEEDAADAESPTLQSYREGQFNGFASALSLLAALTEKGPTE